MTKQVGVRDGTLSVGRLAGLQGIMADQGIDLVVVGPTANLHYLLGYQAMAFDRLTVLLVARKSAAMVIPDFDLHEFVAKTGFDQAIPWSDTSGPARSIATAFEMLEGLPDDRVTAVDDELPFSFLLHLASYLGSGNPIPASTLLMPLRMIKTTEEQEKLAQAGELVSLGMDMALERIRVGITERQLASEIQVAMRTAGTEPQLVLVGSGPGSVPPHHRASGRELRKGEPVLIDIEARVDGYIADIAQQAYLGHPPADYMLAYEAVCAAEEAAVVAARAGTAAGDVYRCIKKAIAEASLGEWLSSKRTGHGIGLDLIEPPILLVWDETELRPGVVIAVAPAVYIPGRYGIRIDNVILVSSAEPRRLTNGVRPLHVIP
jgi:Xaa-Pro aminopeptidase